METGEKYVQIPEEYSRRKLNALYREIPLKDMTSRLLRKYFNAMANLYGVVPLGKALEIIDSQNPSLVTKEEFFAFVEIARHECEDYYILQDDELYLDGKVTGRLDWLIIDVPLLCDNDDALREVRICQQDLNNSTRMYHNRGYTPNEIATMTKPEDRKLKSLYFGPGIRAALSNGTMDPDKLLRALSRGEERYENQVVTGSGRDRIRQRGIRVPLRH